MDWNRDSVKQLRQSLRLTQMEFADLLGCRQQTISEWEQGLYVPANAYGKLLTQIQGRAPFQGHIPLAKPEIDTEPLYEPEFNRPFDPAID